MSCDEQVQKTAGTRATGPTKCFRLFNKRERWGLTWRGWLALGLGAIGCLGVFLLTIHPFLAPTERVPASVLVVEGWVHQYAINAAVAEFRAGGYQRVFTTGGPIKGTGDYSSDYNTAASVGASLLRQAGLPSEVLQMVPCRVRMRDRTYNAAVALREYFWSQHLDVRSMNVVTEGAHARRTRLLFEKAFGAGVEVGIIAIPDPDYDARRWWRFSEGFREVTGETIAYLYARLLFHPAAPTEAAASTTGHS